MAHFSRDTLYISTQIRYKNSLLIYIHIYIYCALYFLNNKLKKVLYLVHKSHSLVPLQSHINAVHNLMAYFFKIHLNIILSSTSNLLSSLFFLQVCQPEACMQLLPLSYVAHAPPIVVVFVSVVFVCLFENYPLRNYAALKP